MLLGIATSSCGVPGSAPIWRVSCEHRAVIRTYPDSRGGVAPRELEEAGMRNNVVNLALPPVWRDSDCYSFVEGPQLSQCSCPSPLIFTGFHERAQVLTAKVRCRIVQKHSRGIAISRVSTV